jgi:diguanylate cyclase (GGDEF)-like protein
LPQDVKIPIESRADRIDLLRLAAALGYLLAAAAAVGATILPDPNTADHRPFRILAAVLVVIGLALAAGRRLPPFAVKFIAIDVAVALTCFAIAVARPLGVSPLFLIYAGLIAGYFCSRREAIGHLAFLYVATGVGVQLGEPGHRAITYLVTVSIVTVVAAVVGHVSEKERRLRAELNAVASTDSLTGLLNRRAFMAAFAREQQRALRAGLPLAVVLFDLDHFKDVNDRFGHAAGDQALQRFAQILVDERRQGDLAARMGGEEFLVALFDCDEEGARKWAQRIVERLARETTGGEVNLTASAGVAEADPAATLDEVLHDADLALYAAKAAGRDRVVAVSDPGVRDSARRRAAWPATPAPGS